MATLQPKAPLALGDGKRTWASYLLAVGFGLSFSTTLLFNVWRATEDALDRSFGVEAQAVVESIIPVMRSATDLGFSFSAVAQGRPSGDSLITTYADELLNRYRFIKRISLVRHTGEFAADQLEIIREFTTPDPGATAFPAERLVDLPSADIALAGYVALVENSAKAVPIPGQPRLGRFEYALVVGIPADDTASTPARMVVFHVRADSDYAVAIASGLAVKVDVDSPSVLGRNTLLRHANTRSLGWIPLPPLEFDHAERIDQDSVRISVSKPVYFADLDQGLLLTGLVLSLGTTLLLVALAHAKESQARELRERNALVEREVELATKKLGHARDEAVQASRVKSDFLASMSHEIRTPLNAIIGMAELLAESPLTAEQSQYVTAYRRAADALLALVNDILDLSKIEAGRLELESISFDPSEVCEQAADIHAVACEEKDLELVLDIDACERDVLGDPTRLRQVLLNLVGNAIKFTDNGEIVVTMRTVESRDAEHVALEFSVSDSGIGIPAEKVSTIFESFSQVDSSTTRRFGGTGLGLAISKRLVEKMRGDIRVESKEGVGSTFRFRVELVDAGVRAVPEHVPVLGGRNILIFAQSATVARVLRKYLEEAGANVVDPGGQAATDKRLTVIVDLKRADADQHFSEFADATVLSVVGNLQLREESSRGSGVTALVKPVKRASLLEAVMAGGSASVQPVKTTTDDSAPRRRLLLVEDNDDNRLLIRAYLKNENFEMVEAVDGAAAVDLVRSEHFDLVLMDVQMPVMDGHQATQAIRRWESERGREQVPILALTAHATADEARRCIESGCTLHVSKPVKKQTLLDAIASLSGGKSSSACRQEATTSAD